MVDSELIGVVLSGWSAPDIQRSFSLWTEGVLSRRRFNVPAPLAPPLPDLFALDSLWRAGPFWDAAVLLAAHAWDENNQDWLAALIPAALIHPQVLRLLLSNAAAWLHTHSLWTPPEAGVGRTRSEDLVTDLTSDGWFRDITVISMAGAFFSFCRWCSRQVRGAQRQRWQQWAQVVQRLFRSDSVLWQAASGMDMVILHAFAARADQVDFAPVLSWLDLEAGERRYSASAAGAGQIAGSLSPPGLRQRLLQEVADVCSVPVNWQALQRAGMVLDEIRRYLNQFTSVRPVDRELATAYFLLNLIEWILAEQPDGVFPLLPASFPRSGEHPLRGFVDLVGASGATANRLEMLLSPVMIDSYPGAPLHTDYVASGKAQVLLGYLRQVRGQVIQADKRI